MEQQSNLYIIPKDILLELILSADPHSLVSLSSSSKELNLFLQDTYVLQQLGIVHNVSTPRNVSEIEVNLDLQMLLKDSRKKLIEAIERRDNNFIIKTMKLSSLLFNDRIDQARLIGDDALVDLMKRFKTILYNDTMEFAAEKGNEEIVEAMILLGANNFKSTLELAACKGYKKIVEMLVATDEIYDFEEAYDCASSNGYEDIAQLLEDL